MKQLDRIGVQIHREQQIYTEARVGACDSDYLDGSRGIRYPVRVWLESRESGDIGVDDPSNDDFGDSSHLGKEAKMVPLELVYENAKCAISSQIL